MSVVVPTHQAVDYLPDTLGRILSQTWTDLEVVVVDNGSTDGTSEAVSALGDPRIRYHWQEDSGLPANSRNVGIRLASGEWVAFCDADDVWYPDKLARVMEAAAGGGTDVICHAVAVMRDGSKIGRRAYAPDTRRMLEELLYHGNTLTTSATTVRRDVLLKAGGFSEDRAKRTVEDFDLWVRLAADGRGFLFLPDVLGEYLVRSGGASADLEWHYAALFGVLDEWYVRLAGAGDLRSGAALRMRARARLAMVRDTFGRLPGLALRRLLGLPAEVLALRRRIRGAERGGVG